MNATIDQIARESRPVVPVGEVRAVGLVGAGSIVQHAHLPAYRSAGIPVAAIYDRDASTAARVAAQFGIPHVAASLDELLASEIGIVDVAVPSAAQAAILPGIIGAGIPVLAQKPLAPTLAEAQALASLAEARAIPVAVNQQLRFEQSMVAIKKSIEHGLLGDVVAIEINVNVHTPWESWPWAASMPRLEVLVHSIHYHDVIRWLLGEPDSTFAVAGRLPGLPVQGETITSTLHRYADGPYASITSNHTNSTGDGYALIRVQGTEGTIRGTLGLLYDYPHGRLDTLEIQSGRLPDRGWVPYPITTRWIPDAFVGTIGDLLSHLATGSALRSSISDNVKTMALVESIYRSIDEGVAVRMPTDSDGAVPRFFG